MRQKRQLKTQIQKTKTYKDKYKRKNMISLCFDDLEYLKIQKITDALNVPRATAAREILISNADLILSKIKKNNNTELILSLNMIGNNLNQITKKINSNINLFLTGEAENFALSIHEINEALIKILKEIKS